MDGFVSTGGGIPDHDRYRDVRVLLYAANGTLLDSKLLGYLPANHGSRNISINTSANPKYIIFQSPDFWTGQMQVEYSVRTDDGYRIEYATSENELPTTSK